MPESREVLNALADAAVQAHEAGLIHVSDAEPGIRRCVFSATPAATPRVRRRAGKWKAANRK